MSDRTSAEIFGEIFSLLADKVPHEEIVTRLWHESYKYDFSAYQMESDAALEKLGLARRVPDPDAPGYTRFQYRSRRNDGWDD